MHNTKGIRKKKWEMKKKHQKWRLWMREKKKSAQKKKLFYFMPVDKNCLTYNTFLCWLFRIEKWISFVCVFSLLARSFTFDANIHGMNRMWVSVWNKLKCNCFELKMTTKIWIFSLRLQSSDNTKGRKWYYYRKEKISILFSLRISVVSTKLDRLFFLSLFSNTKVCKCYFMSVGLWSHFKRITIEFLHSSVTYI